MTHSLDVLFRPRSIAVIGASRQRKSIAGEVFHNLVSQGFPGPIYPVNPAARAVQSVRAYPSIEEVPDDIDLAVIVVPQHAVLDAASASARRGVRGLVVITAGFAEIGPEGKKLQDELVRIVRSHGMRMLGPNCLGLLNTEPAIQLNATFAPTWPPPGPVAIASQSGAVGLALLDYSRDLGIGISQFASTGNKAELSGNDLLEHWEDDPATRVILLYLESLGNPIRFMHIARRVSRKKLPLAGALAGATGIQTPADKIMVTFAPPPRCGRGPSRGRAERWGMGQADDRVPRSRRPPNLIAGAGRIVRVNFAGGQQCFSAERVSAPSRGRARS